MVIVGNTTSSSRTPYCKVQLTTNQMMKEATYSMVRWCVMLDFDNFESNLKKVLKNFYLDLQKGFV